MLQHRLIKGWRQCPQRPPYLFPGDKPLIKKLKNRPGKKYLDFTVVPMPYIGNLSKADIYILSANPGLKPHDYSLPKKSREARFKTLRQKFNRYEFQFRSLDPKLKGYDYWKRKFGSIIKAIKIKRQISDEEAARYLGDRLACLDLLPYHSQYKPSLSRFMSLPSVQAMLDFVRFAKLIERANDGKALIIVVRAKKYWQQSLDLKEGKKNVVVYDPRRQARLGSLGLNSPGGKAILRYIAL